jgi:ATP-dependent Clp protease ATP-binding subunit ClpA
MFKRFTEGARNVVIQARTEARRRNDTQIGSQHLLLAMVTTDCGIATRVLTGAGMDAARVDAEIDRLADTPARVLDAADAAALRTIGIDLDAVLAHLEESFGPKALRSPSPTPRRESLWPGGAGATRFTPRSKKIIELALREAIRLGHPAIGAEHVLLGLLRDGAGQGARILTDARIPLDRLRDETVAAMAQAA